ncbi:MAG: hypothetical protein ACFFAO_02625 [Candidatus Hermodarchaeota archaeon]
MILSFSMIAPSMIMYIIFYIRKSTAKYESSTIFGKYHLHEGFIGIILIILSISLIILRLNLLFLTHPFWRRLSFIFVLVQVFSIIFIYLGSFFFFRDWHDIIRLKLIEAKPDLNSNLKTDSVPIFNQITQDDLHFFRFSRFLIYPFGVIMTIISISIIIYGIDIFPRENFDVNNESVIYLGYFLCFISGGMIGVDWLRIFKLYYPELYEEIRKVINQIEYS